MPSKPTHSDEVRQDIADAVLAQVRSILPPGTEEEVTLDTSLFELGLDSVTVMGAINRIEASYGMRFREEWLYDVQTCRDLVECVAAAEKGDSALPREEREASSPTPPPANGHVPPEHYDVALFPERVALDGRLAGAAAIGLAVPFFREKEQVRTPLAVVEGREVVSYTSFDYLGLAGHPRVAAAAKEAIDRFGTSASASRLVGGESTVLRRLDEELARFLGAEAAIAFPSGYGTNASLFGHLFGAEDLILYDELAHNSIAQGAALSKARRRPFAHNDLDALEALLRDLRAQYRRVVVAVEGVYSMDGDYPDLPRLMELRDRHHALLYVDEAHSVGVLGATGRGICEHFGCQPAGGDLWMGTISKALASGGGYLAGRKELIEYLKYTTPAFVFATACSPPNAAAALAALGVLRDEPQRVTRLRERSALFLRLAREANLNTGASRDTPVVPVILGDSVRCTRASRELLRRGIDAQPILYPAVRESAARLRFFITSEHTEAQIAGTVEAVADCVAGDPARTTP